MKLLFNKLLTLFVFIRFPKVPSQFRYFIRFFYLGKIIQLKYFYKDYFDKRPYKEIHFDGEFQHELIYVIPFAYWHFKNSTLKKTVASKFTKSLYFFSPCHEERYNERNWKSNFNIEIPNSAHNFRLNTKKWERVPFKEYYSNKTFVYEKPILVIANRYNTEWEGEPVSYFNLEMLSRMIKKLSSKYQIIYNRPSLENITNDNSEILELNDCQYLSHNFKEVILLDDLYEELKIKVQSFNELQLMVYANCNNFISVHGGTATLASYFGGTNLIYSKKGHEHFFKEFNSIFPKLSGAKIVHAKTETEVDELIGIYY